MKILVLNWQCIKSPLGGGAEVHLHEIFKRLVTRGCDITLFCYRFDGSEAEEEIDGIKIIRKGSRNLFNYLVPVEYRRRFRHEKYDIIIDDINKIPFYTPLFVKEPLLAISHHFFGRSIFRESGLAAGSYVYFSEYLVDLVYKRTPFVVVSQSTLDEFVSRGFNPVKFSIAKNAINHDEFPMAVTEKLDSPTVTFFGRLKKYKSIDHLLRAFALIAGRVDGSQLYILGRGSFRPELEKLAARLGIADRTKFFGYVSNEDKVRLLAASHVVVNTSMKEGWGITNIEANACGTPVVSADVPGLRDSVDAGVSGLLYEYGNIAQIAERLYCVLTDDELRQKLSLGAIGWARSHNWDDSARIVYDKCLEVINRK